MQEATQCKSQGSCSVHSLLSAQVPQFYSTEAEFMSQLFHIYVKQAWDSAEVGPGPYLFLSHFSHHPEPNPFSFYPTQGKPVFGLTVFILRIASFSQWSAELVLPKAQIAFESTLKLRCQFCPWTKGLGISPKREGDGADIHGPEPHSRTLSTGDTAGWRLRSMVLEISKMQSYSAT